MASEKSKKPKSKGKNRLFIGDLCGITLSPKIMKTWAKGWRKPFAAGHKKGGGQQ
jgi:hypothetical protein